MEARIAKLEELVTDTRERLAKIEARLEQTATKTDLAELHTEMQKGFADMAKWMIGTAVGMGAAGIVVMTFVLNNAIPKPIPPVPVAASAPASIVIYATPPGIAADAKAPADKP